MAVFFASKTGTVSRFHRELCSSTRKEGKLTKGRVTDRRPDGPSASKPLGHGQCTLRPRREAAAHALDDVRGRMARATADTPIVSTRSAAQDALQVGHERGPSKL